MAPTTLGDMLAHEPYNAGRELINAGKFELAIEHFSDLLETTKEASGELSEAAAPVYYQYGAALFLQAEDASTVFANGVTDSSDGDGDDDENAGISNDNINGDAENETSDTGDSAVESAVRETVEANAAVIEDLEIAWEVLEVARSILTPLAAEAPAARELLARVHLKLGDVQKLNGQFSGALADYEQCLALRRQFLPPPDRGLADVHYQIAQTAEYAAADVASVASTGPNSSASGSTDTTSGSGIATDSSSSSSSGPSDGRTTSSSSTAAVASLCALSLQNYEACRDVFQLMVDALKRKAAETVTSASDITLRAGAAITADTPGGSSSVAQVLNTGLEATTGTMPAVPGLSTEEAEELADYGEILKELHETIASAQDGANLADVRSVLPSNVAKGSSSSEKSLKGASGSEAGVTTIGFGISTNPTGAPAVVSTTGFVNNSTSSAGASSACAVPAMLVAKKKKRAAPEPVAKPQGQVKPVINQETSAEKKVKSE